MSDSSRAALWKKYLRYDPTRWLLETSDSSILLWYQLDIAHRPEGAPGVIAARERVLYSESVQAIFAAQDAWGFWSDAEKLASPRYTATLWNLALLAELGIPRASRRARNACEFILQNFLTDTDEFAGLNEAETGYLLRAFGYFNYAADPRTRRVARALSARAQTLTTRLCALWGCRAFRHDVEIARATHTLSAHVLADETLCDRDAYTFPQFQPRDALFTLRVLAEYECAADARVAPLLDELLAKQNEHAQWTLERALNAQLTTPLENQNAPSRWLTLNALRVLTKIILRAN